MTQRHNLYFPHTPRYTYGISQQIKDILNRNLYVAKVRKKLYLCNTVLQNGVACWARSRLAPTLLGF